MAAYKDLNTVIDTMHNHDCVAKWDVVVSYSVLKLNLLLQKVWPASGLGQVTVPMDLPIPGLEDMRSHVEMVLVAPKLQFDVEGQGRAVLDFTMSSGFFRLERLIDGVWKPDQEPRPIQAGVIVQAKLPIVAVSGSGSESFQTVSQKSFFFSSPCLITSWLIFNISRLKPL